MIDSLESIVPSAIVKNLQGFRFLGNQAAHELAVGKKSDLSLAIEVIEDVLNIAYELNYKSSRLHALYDKIPKSPGPNQ